MAGRELKALFRAFREGDELAFRRAASSIIEEEETKQHVALARDLKTALIGSGDVPLSEAVTVAPPPTDKDGGFPLAEVRRPQRYLSDLVLARPLEIKVMGLADEFRHWPDLDARAIPRRQRILFYGRPGTGKTSAAEGLASEIGVPLLVVRLDSVVSSLLGETASNLRRIFDYARRGSWVILFDEFDALAKSRDDPTEHGEIKRVVSAFLQMLDSFTGRSLLIAASNHEQLLDSAVWRRFDEIIAFGPPNQVEAKRILKMRLTPVTYPARAVDEVVRSLRGLPQAAVENVAWSAMRAAVLRGDSSVRADDLETAASNVRSRPW